jgi:hypothetical protein
MLLIPVILLLALSSFAATALDVDSEYIIPELKTTGNIEPQPASGFMEPLSGLTHLMPEKNIEPEPTRFYLRRRFWNGKTFEYILFEGGVHKESCYRGLSFFRVEGMNSLQTLKLKFYTAKDFNFYGDAEDVYFQDSLVLVPAINLFYRWGGKVRSARRIDPPVGCLEIRSDPQEVKVHIDGNFAGLTPLFLAGQKCRLANVSLSSPGYLPLSQDISVYPESTISYLGSLSHLPTLSPVGPNLKFLLRENASLPEEYEARENSLRKYTHYLERLRDSITSHHDSIYPVFSKDGKETGAQENARLKKFRYGKESQRKTLSAPFDSSLTIYLTALDSLKNMRERLECAQVPLDLGGENLQLLDYDANLRSLPFQVDVHTQNLWFTYIGSLSLSPQENETLHAKKKSVRMHMAYRKIPLLDASGQKYYFTLDQLQVQIDTLLKIDTVGSGFRYGKNLWKTPDSLVVEERIKNCLIQDVAQLQKGRTRNWLSLWKGGSTASYSTGKKRAGYWTGTVVGLGLSTTFGILAGSAYLQSRNEYSLYRHAQSEADAQNHADANENKKRQAWIFGGLSALSLLGAGTTLVFAF